jgi:hypothetical protein
VGLANATGAYWIRSTLSTCSSTSQPNALGIAYYTHDALNTAPTTSAWPDNTDPCANVSFISLPITVRVVLNVLKDPLEQTVPWFSITPTPTPAVTQAIEIATTINATGNFVWTMNGSGFRANYNNPVLLLAKAGNTSYPFDPVCLTKPPTNF